MDKEEIRQLVRKYALQNAVKYNAAPQPGAVMGKVMQDPEVRPHAKDVSVMVNEVLALIGNMSPDEWKRELEATAPELARELKTKKEPEKGLPELPLDGRSVVMRFAPNPNGPPTLGSARGMVVNSEYVKKYDGKFIIRFDDTDPQTKRPLLEAYQWYLEDCEWLGAKPHEVIIASDRIPLYYEFAEKLIQKDGAYVCFCEQEEFKNLKDAKRACPHREQGVEKNIGYWKKMLAGDYGEHEAVLRIKTDITHKDPAIRDWVAFRIIRTPHPRVGDKYVVWPLLDFESAIEDHLCETTHIIRGKDLRDSEERQKYIYRYMGWTYPKTLHWGRVKILEFGKLSTSGLKKAIAEGVYTGWDDPRVPTIRAIRRRGIQPEALRKYMLDLGMGETDISMSMDGIYAENRKLVEPMSNRYFFVWDPVELEIEHAPSVVSKPPLHPSDSRGVREIQVDGRVLVCRDDVARLEPGARLRLKDLYNIEVTCMEPLRARFIGADIDTVKREKLRIIHWAPVDGIAVRVLSPDGEFKGIGENGIRNELHRIVQFERFGFVRIDSINREVVAYFTHD
ncbi:MAG TPA: glutamate--tRNA ligase [Candidatus Methanoperedenaceae archaeon]|nr:glutamate--tRNA ligase [Candidatus Methanoperedenaceae archaeon]